MLPTTSKACPGVLVPIPVLPLPKTLSLSIPPLFNVSILLVVVVPAMSTRSPLAVMFVDVFDIPSKYPDAAEERVSPKPFVVVIPPESATLLLVLDKRSFGFTLANPIFEEVTLKIELLLTLKSSKRGLPVPASLTKIRGLLLLV